MVSVLVASALALLTAPASAPAGDLGFQWATIGDPGNRAILDSELPNDPRFSLTGFGSVDRRYRMSTFETTNAQVFEFVQAYRPHMAESEVRSYGGVTFTGLFDADGLPVYRLPKEAEKVGGRLTWDLSAKMANWLHNGKATTEDAFRSGAYDFEAIEASPNDPNARQRQDGAKVWIPDYDEWAKAAYYDPDRYGEGEAGYWPYPYGLDRPPEGGLPGDGGETNAYPWHVLEPDLDDFSFLDVGAYDQSGPWGLFDVSGGQMELLEEFAGGGDDSMLSGFTAGSKEGFTPTVAERLDAAGEWLNFSLTSPRGFRFASAIPAPAPTTVFVLAAGRAFITRRRKGCNNAESQSRSVCSPSVS